MDILIIDNKTKHLQKIKKLAESNGDNVKIIKCKNIDLINPADFDLIILSGGSKYSVMGNPQKYIKEIELIKNIKTPILGICLGFQLIIRAFGGTLETFNLGNRTKGIIEIQKKREYDIFKDIQNFKVYESHRWRAKKMPENFVILAESQDGVEIIKHKKKIIYGVQFHPEVFSNKTCGKQIFDNFVKIARGKGRPSRRSEATNNRIISLHVVKGIITTQYNDTTSVTGVTLGSISRSNFLKLFFVLYLTLFPNFVFANNALDIVISEIAWMGISASSSDEWIELYNNTNKDINIENWSIYGADTGKCLNFADADNSNTYIISAHNYLIYANHEDDIKNDSKINIVDIWDASIGMNNTNPGQITLYNNSDCVGVVIDMIDCSNKWFAGDNTTKQTMERNNFAISGNNSENWHTSIITGGTPKSQNSKIDVKEEAENEQGLFLSEIPQEVEQEIKQGIEQEMKKQVVYVSGVIINEILPSPEGPDAENEWIELFNTNNFVVDISGYKLSDIKGTTKTYIFPENTKISKYGFLLLMRPETKITLNNTGDGIKLFYPDDKIADEVVFGKAKSNQSYSRNDSEWEYTKNLTPNAINVFNTISIDKSIDKNNNQQDNNNPATTDNKNLASINASSENLSSSNSQIKTNILDQYLTILIAITISILSAITIFFLKKNSQEY